MGLGNFSLRTLKKHLIVACWSKFCQSPVWSQAGVQRCLPFPFFCLGKLMFWDGTAARPELISPAGNWFWCRLRWLYLDPPGNKYSKSPCSSCWLAAFLVPQHTVLSPCPPLFPSAESAVLCRVTLELLAQQICFVFGWALSICALVQLKPFILFFSRMKTVD